MLAVTSPVRGNGFPRTCARISLVVSVRISPIVADIVSTLAELGFGIGQISRRLPIPQPPLSEILHSLLATPSGAATIIPSPAQASPGDRPPSDRLPVACTPSS